MSHIPDADIERIKKETDLVALVQSRGIKLEKHGGKDWKGLCPFHGDKNTPNLIVSPAKGLWHCMACSKAGNAIQFVQHHDGMSFRHAFEVLAQGSKAAYAARPLIRQSSVPVLPCPLDAQADDATLLAQVNGYYHERLKQSVPAQDYLASRGLNDPALIEKYQLGYADRSLGLRMPESNRKEGETLRVRLTQLGVWRESGHEHFNGCITVPLYDVAGKIVSFYGRRIGTGNVKHLYAPGPHRGLFHPSAFDADEIILCEAVIDALTFCAHGFPNTTCLYGTEGWTEEHTAAMKNVRRVKIAYDADEAGDRAAARDAERLQALGIEVWRIKFPWSMDANEYARKVTPATKSLSLLITAAQWMGKGKGEALHPQTEAAPPCAQSMSRKEPWEQVPVEIAASLAKELGQPLKGVAMEVDAESGEPLPCVSSDSLKTGQGWSERPYWPAPYSEVEAQQNQLRQLAEERGLLPHTPAPTSSLAASVSSLEVETTAKNKNAVAPSSAPTLEARGEAWFLVIENREYRITGLDKIVGADHLKIALRLQCGDRFHLDQIDLMRDMERRRFIERASEETGLTPDLLKRDMGRVLLAVETEQTRMMKPAEAVAAAVELSPEERDEALKWLREPNLISRLKKAFHLAGIIGEENNTLVAYLAGVSRKLERPLAIIIQSASAAGKTTLMDAVLSFFPEEERVKYSAMTGQSLYYLGETNLQHKILAVVEEAGAEKASYALKLLQSEGELTIASTGKDPNTGRMVTQEYHVEGPVMIFFTTTAINLDEELQNRCLTLAVDESNEQTERIHRLQRERRTLAGLIAQEERKDILTRLKNAQRLLQPIAVLNPYALGLTFPSGRTRNRRDHEKYLTLIDSIALLHQHQRSRGQHLTQGRIVEYIEVTLDDIALANELAPEVLGRSLDELPPQTRRLLDHLRALVKTKLENESAKTATTFSRKEVRDVTGWSLTQVSVHLQRLVELEYIAVRCGRMGGPFVYELIVSVEAPETIAHIGLIDVEELRQNCTYNGEVTGLKPPVTGGNQTASVTSKPLNGTPLSSRYRGSANAHQGASARQLVVDKP